MTNTAGRSPARAAAASPLPPAGPRERATACAARMPLASSPAQDSGPMAANSAAVSSISPVAIA
jgi:hypothetical protein